MLVATVDKKQYQLTDGDLKQCPFLEVVQQSCQVGKKEVVPLPYTSSVFDWIYKFLQVEAKRSTKFTDKQEIQVQTLQCPDLRSIAADEYIVFIRELVQACNDSKQNRMQLFYAVLRLAHAIQLTTLETLMTAQLAAWIKTLSGLETKSLLDGTVHLPT